MDHIPSCPTVFHLASAHSAPSPSLPEGLPRTGHENMLPFPKALELPGSKRVRLGDPRRCSGRSVQPSLNLPVRLLKAGPKGRWGGPRLLGDGFAHIIQEDRVSPPPPPSFARGCGSRAPDCSALMGGGGQSRHISHHIPFITLFPIISHSAPPLSHHIPQNPTSAHHIISGVHGGGVHHAHVCR